MRQAALDVKYLSDRYGKGKEKATTFMEKMHRVLHYQSICMSNPTIVQMQADMGPNGLLG